MSKKNIAKKSPVQASAEQAFAAPATRDEILAKLKINKQTEAVLVKPLGMTINLRRLSFSEMAQVQLENSGKPKHELNCAIAARMCCDLLPEDLDALINGHPTAASAIINAALDLPMPMAAEISEAELGKS